MSSGKPRTGRVSFVVEFPATLVDRESRRPSPLARSFAGFRESPDDFVDWLVSELQFQHDLRVADPSLAADVRELVYVWVQGALRLRIKLSLTDEEADDAALGRILCALSGVFQDLAWAMSAGRTESLDETQWENFDPEISEDPIAARLTRRGRTRNLELDGLYRAWEEFHDADGRAEREQWETEVATDPAAAREANDWTDVDRDSDAAAHE